MGSIYSHYPPPAGAELGLGKWTSFDITLVGRHVTVVRDGKVYHDTSNFPVRPAALWIATKPSPAHFFYRAIITA